MVNKVILVALKFLFVVSIQAQNWVERTAHPGDPRHHPATFVINDTAYLLTGSTETANTNDFYQYDPVEDSWATLPDFPGVARSFSYAASTNGKGYLGFGVSDTDYLNDLWEYDPATGIWTELSSCPCTKRAHPAFVIQDGRIFVGLGNYTSNLKDWWEYNIATDTWRQLPDLPGPSRHHPYHFAVGGSVYVGLGHGVGMTIYKDWYRWDLTTETWETMNDFPAQARVAGTQFTMGDRGFVLSGDGDDHSTMATGEFWEYDYITDTWTELPPHPGVSRWAPGSFAIGNTAYFTSGQVRDGNPNEGLQNDLWSFTYEAIAANENTEELKTNLVIYPNPSSEKVSIDGLSTAQVVTVSIFDNTGKLIETVSYNGGFMDISSLTAGLYFLSISEDDKVIERMKLIKE